MYKYLEVLNNIEALIYKEMYKAGDKLPSIKKLSEYYGCNKSTVIRALEELEKNHMIYSIPKSGYYVVKSKNTLRDNMDHKLIWDFESSSPDPNIFPYLDFQHCINKAIDIYKNDLFIYGTPQGLPSLIKVVKKQLENYQVFAREENICITSGVQQNLAILTSMPFKNNKKTILIEQPGYHLFISYLETHNIPVKGITRTNKGIDLVKLESIFKNEDIKFFYTMPRFHNPLGTSYSEKEKKAIAALGKKYDVYIVEDDYLADLDTNSKADPIYSYDSSEHVIYMKSYSKIIFPGLRVGIAVLPQKLVENFSRYKTLMDVDTSMISQGALEIYIKSGMFNRHKEKIKESYLIRSKNLARSLRKNIEHSKNVVHYIDIKNPCIHRCIVLDERINIEMVIRRLKKKSILVSTASNNYLNEFKKESLLKINVSNVKEENIEEGIDIIFKEIEV
ncbi:PLP-dependent aminotransferase family protein [Clostridium sp.]|uniref:PLP-dependent aminotransferase family protein n=1 Tax=Clostridium sp. TaxID=1506 RepID=UPI003463E7B8